jgi:hypothetical protein
MLARAGCIMFLLLSAQGCHDSNSGQAQELKIEATLLVDSSEVYPWTFRVEADGKGLLTLRPHGSRREERPIAIPADRLASFQKALVDEGYFGLPKQIGRQVPDGSRKALEISVGKVNNAVTIYDFSVPEEKAVRQRAERIWSLVLTLFDEKETVRKSLDNEKGKEKE